MSNALTAVTFWDRVDRSGGPDACWPWLLGLNGRSYGRASGKLAHRLAYTFAVGPIPDDYQIDHLCHSDDPECPGSLACRHRRCCNPSHMELVTNQENVQRGQLRTGMCRHGLHPKTEPGLCEPCHRAQQGAGQKRRYAEKREAMWAAAFAEYDARRAAA